MSAHAVLESLAKEIGQMWWYRLQFLPHTSKHVNDTDQDFLGTLFLSCVSNDIGAEYTYPIPLSVIHILPQVLMFETVDINTLSFLSKIRVLKALIATKFLILLL